MFLLNEQHTSLNITTVNETEIYWFSDEFYKCPEVVETYTSGARDSRIKPIYDYLSLYTNGYRAINDDIVDIRTRPEGRFFFDTDAYWNAIVCLDKEESKSLYFFERTEHVQPEDDEEEPIINLDPYTVGDKLLYTHPAEYNRAIIYNSKKLHIDTDMNLFQVFHFRIEK